MPQSSAETLSMTTGLRVTIFVTALILIVAGAFGLFVIVQLLAMDTGDSAYVIGGQKEFLFRLLWAVVAAAFVAAGISLLRAAIRRVRSNMVPGPTLYVLGAALVVIGMFLISDAAMASGVLVGVAGLAIMWLEFRSKYI